MRRQNAILLATVLAFLAPALSNAETHPDGSASPKWAALPAGVTNLFRWDDQTLAAFDSGTGEIFALNGDDSTRAAPKLLIDLELPVAKESGFVFSDPLERSTDGHFYLLSRGQGEIFHFGPNGKLLNRIPAPFAANEDLELASDH